MDQKLRFKLSAWGAENCPLSIVVHIFEMSRVYLTVAYFSCVTKYLHCLDSSLCLCLGQIPSRKWEWMLFYKQYSLLLIWPMTSPSRWSTVVLHPECVGLGFDAFCRVKLHRLVELSLSLVRDWSPLYQSQLTWRQVRLLTFQGKCYLLADNDSKLGFS